MLVHKISVIHALQSLLTKESGLVHGLLHSKPVLYLKVAMHTYMIYTSILSVISVLMLALCSCKMVEEDSFQQH